jgi:bromodomain adjacent to zinc finger domain protein 1A
MDEDDQEAQEEEADDEHEHDETSIHSDSSAQQTASTSSKRKIIKLAPKKPSKPVPNSKKNANANANTSAENDEDVINVSSSSDSSNPSSETANGKRSTRKRKAAAAAAAASDPVQPSPPPARLSRSLKSRSLKVQDTSTSSKENNNNNKSGSTKRSSRALANYAEVSDDLTDPDDSPGYHKAPKRNKTLSAASNSSKPVLNDSLHSNTNSRNTEMVDRLKKVERLLNDMMKHKDSWPFLKPVSKRDAPDYSTIIQRPMDFSTIKNNINHFKYADYTHIVEDVRLVFENCREYNEPGSDIYETGERLHTYFESHAKQAGLLDTKRLALPYS